MFFALSTLASSIGFSAVHADFSCAVSSGTTQNELWNLTQRNCARVNLSSIEIPEIVKHSTWSNQQAWEQRLKTARGMCTSAEREKDATIAAQTALNAWGNVMMQGRECCNRVVPPFCYGDVPSPVQRFAPFIICVIVCIIFLLLPLCCKQLTAPKLMRLPARPPIGSFAVQADRQVASRTELGTATGAARSSHSNPMFVRRAQTLRDDLQKAWGFFDTNRQLGSSPLRLLPGAREWGNAAIDICMYLYQTFGFQEDNVRNQFEHLLSLWRSQVAMVGDQSAAAQAGYDGCLAIEEAGFLPEAIKQLHGSLLEGFVLWRKRFSECEEVGIQTRLESRTQLGGMPRSNFGGNEELLRLFPKLAEIIVFLLVWGEAGNIRFMPELLYFISDLLLSAENPEMFTLPFTPGCDWSPFLVQVIRPIYNVIFDETYRCVEVDVPCVEVKWTSPGHRDRLLMVKAVNVSRSGDRIQSELRFDIKQIQNENQQQWQFQPVGFRDSGERLYQIRWVADKTLCLHVDVPASGQPRLTLQEAHGGSELQQFSVNTRTNRILWTLESTTYGIAAISDGSGGNSAKAVLVQQREVSHSLQMYRIDGKSGTGKETKKLHLGFEAFLPPDTANYDDWNELFCDPARMVANLVLHDNRKLFLEFSHNRRLEALPRVDWRSSLKNVKTHREVHSWWGVFASTQRIWLLHALAFLVLVCWSSTRVKSPYDIAGDMSIEGRTTMLIFAAAGLFVPFHAVCWAFATWFTSGQAKRSKLFKCSWYLVVRLMLGLLWVAPLVTYSIARSLKTPSGSSKDFISVHDAAGIAVIIVHYSLCSLGAFMLLFLPAWPQEGGSSLTRVSFYIRLGRGIFWIIIFGAKIAVSIVIINAFSQAATDLVLCPLTHESVSSLLQGAFTPVWSSELLQALAFWGTAFFVFVADTQLWFIVGCTLWGIVVGFAQRQWKCRSFMCEQAVAQIPKLFSEKIIPYAPARPLAQPPLPQEEAPVRQEESSSSSAARTSPAKKKTNATTAAQEESSNSSSHPLTSLVSSRFPAIWDRIIDHMRYEDKLDDQIYGQMCFHAEPRIISYRHVQSMLASSSQRPHEPSLFTPTTCAENCLKRETGLLSDPHWPKNTEVQWRLAAFARSLSLNLPRPFRAPYIPGFTVLIPHYGEPILMTKDQLFDENDDSRGVVSVMTWLEGRYPGEFLAFTGRMLQAHDTWSKAGDRWIQYPEHNWEKLVVWASMRSQTLWRTVAGMVLYQTALDCLYRLQGDKTCTLSQTWDPSDCFTCLVSMQMYTYFNETQLGHTERMLQKFPASLKIAYLNFEDRGAQGDDDCIHPCQQRRYYSCLIDRTCAKNAAGVRIPKFKVELPGFCILGDGKGDNQNHAIPFSRGTFIQCIDANQGAYFEQMLLMPSVFGEFRANAKRIVGFPEHITSDIGSIGDFAASAEFAFGTMLQRSYAALGGRMHYGHPDIMPKLYMMQQGGLSKATKTVNLSEDIFAGMDFTLRGSGREIIHREYFHVCKGRDMGFLTVLGFFSKLSSGAGEVVLTRQSFRLGKLLPLPEFLTFYYAHIGHYLTQYIISRVPPTLVFLWLVMVTRGTESNFQAAGARVGLVDAPPSNQHVMATLLSLCFSVVVGILFNVAQAAPFIAEVWMQQGVFVACFRYLKQFVTLAPLHFIFQAKIIGIYVANELRTGGASYIATGRGLPTQRVPFLTLYKNFAQHAFYDGFRLLGASILVLLSGGAAFDDSNASLVWWLFMLALTISSWLYAPFIFNPYQFSHKYFYKDIQSIRDFMVANGASAWIEWYEKKNILPGKGVRVTVFDMLYWFFLIAIWYTAVESKMRIYWALFSKGQYFWQVVPFLPPLVLSIFVTGLAAVFEPYLHKRYGTGPSAAPSFHLMIVAVVCATLGISEVAVSISFLLSISWWKTVISCLVLKYILLSWFLNAVECLLGLGWCPTGYFKAHARLWVYGHRLAMDLVVICLLFLTLLPFIVFDRLRDAACTGCSLHNLLLFRNSQQVMVEGQHANFYHRPNDLNDSFHGPKAPLLDCEAEAANLVLDESMLSASYPAFAFLPPRPPQSALPKNDVIPQNLGLPPSRPPPQIGTQGVVMPTQQANLMPPQRVIVKRVTGAPSSRG